MCGLYGFVGNHPRKKEILRGLCICNSERGHHSAGLASVLKNGKWQWMKKAIHPIRFANLPEFSDLANKGLCHIGHTRHATVGEHTDENAHPFICGNTIGAHNGGITNLTEIKNLTKQNFNVDSNYLIYLLDKNNSLEPCRGSLTVTYNQKNRDEILNLMRFGNQLHIIGDQSGEWIAYSSTLGHLAYAMGFANCDFTHHYELKDGEHVRIFLKNNQVTMNIGDTGYKHDNYTRTSSQYNNRSHGHSCSPSVTGFNSPKNSANSPNLYDNTYDCHIQ